ncbi:GNAT family N-acetyltransferase [Cetobacterium somerae]|uniref:GNAT family N-acetyltransferase n=1 Tax=Cetobacterium somerae TaxID=188913 RepID=UPI003D76A085
MRKAIKTDIIKIMQIIGATVDEMKSYGNDQWDENYPQSENFFKDIEAGNLYVDEWENEIRGFICVDYTEPLEYKNVQWRSSNKAMVIHRMAVNPIFRKQGVGISLLQFAENLAVEHKINYLKTDTYSINDKMNSLFKKFNFQLVGKINFLGKLNPFYCYDKLIVENIDKNRFEILLNKEFLTIEEKQELEVFINKMKQCSFKG